MGLCIAQMRINPFVLTDELSRSLTPPSRAPDEIYVVIPHRLSAVSDEIQCDDRERYVTRQLILIIYFASKGF